MKPRHILLLTFIIGLSGGYLAAPKLFSLLSDRNALQPEDSTAATAPETATDADGEMDYGMLIGYTPDKTSGKDDDKAEDDDLASLDGEEFTDSEEMEEEDDPEGENTSPTRITTYKPKHKPTSVDETRKPFREQTFTGKLKSGNWKAPKPLKRRLASKLRSRLKGVDQQSVESFLKDPEARLMLAQWELLNRCNLDVLAKLMRNNRSAKALEPLLNDLEWLSGFVYDGELQNAEIALSMIAHFAQVDPNMSKDQPLDGQPASPWLKRRVAGAIATQFTRNKWYGEAPPLTREEIAEMKKLGYAMPSMPDGSRNKDKKDVFRAARERYLFFAESIDQGLLHSQFGTLPTWQLHFVCGWKGHSPFGTASTMRWLRDNCAAPASAYVGMCGQVPYYPINVYGDSIHSEWYYQPFDVLYPGNFAKETRDVGAVCGGLSHFGASSACSFGVPAITMGEPGHCAYAVYFDGKWHPSNSIAGEDKRSPHYGIWGEYTWKALQMQTDMYEQAAITRDAQLVISLAGVMKDCRNPNNALRLYELAAQMQPLNRPIWAQYMQTASGTLAKRPRRWLGVNEFLCKSIAPEEPQHCADLLLQTVYPDMLKALRSPKQKLEAFESYFRHLRSIDNAQWDVSALLSTQYQSLGKATIYKKRYLQMLADNVARVPEFGSMITWAVKNATHESKAVQRELQEMLQGAIATTPAAKDLISAAVIRAAEELGDIEMANEWSKDYLPDTAGAPVPVSAGALVTLSSYAENQEYILSHAAAIAGGEGHITSEQSDSSQGSESVTLVFPKRTNLARIEILGHGKLSANGYLYLETSQDGKTWKHLIELGEEESAESKLDMSITKNPPSVRYLRITDKGMKGPAQINFRAIRVYDKKNAK